MAGLPLENFVSVVAFIEARSIPKMDMKVFSIQKYTTLLHYPTSSIMSFSSEKHWFSTKLVK